MSENASPKYLPIERAPLFEQRHLALSRGMSQNDPERSLPKVEERGGAGLAR
jgi:hypothetical protein